MKLVPHIYKQEVYAGHPKMSDQTNSETGEQVAKHLEPNQSPVNFFDPDYTMYPYFADVGQKYTVLLHEGDCVYLPSFYFYQYVAKPQNLPDKDGVKPSALAVLI